MKKILLVYHALSSGEFSYAGMEKMLIWLGNSLSEAGYDVTFCTLFDTERSSKYSSKAKSIELGLCYSHSFFQRNITTFITGTKLLHKVLKSKYDYVINFGDTCFFLILFLKTLHNYKMITSERGDPNNSANYLEKLRRKLIKYSDVIVFQTEGAKSFFPELVRHKSLVIANPITIPLECWSRDSCEKRIAFVGRIDFWQKRPDILIKAFDIVHKKHPEYMLDICGSGAELNRLRGIVNDSELSQSVILHGAVQDVRSVLLNSEIFVLTSDFEGIPNALLEAMALGMPVVATDCTPGGAALLIDNGINGFLVKKGDFNNVADSVCKFIEDASLERRMAENARKSMYRFLPHEILNQWKQLFGYEREN